MICTGIAGGRSFDCARGGGQQDSRSWLCGRRIGGDEFGVILPANYDTLSAWRKRAHFGSGIACSIGAAINPISITASVGIALYPDDGRTTTELLASADKSMYAQKRGFPSRSRRARPRMAIRKNAPPALSWRVFVTYVTNAEPKFSSP